MICKIFNGARYMFEYLIDIPRTVITWMLLDKKVIGIKNKQVVNNLKLPQYHNRITIEWTSKISTIDNQGVIIGNNDTSGVLLARISSRFLSMTKKICVCTVYRDDEIIVDESISQLTFDKICGKNKHENDIKSSLILPLVSTNGAKIKWETSGNVDENGWITRTENDTKCVLKAYISSGNIVKEKEFNLTIKAKTRAKKKVLIFVPHGDDELLLAVSVIYKNIEMENDVYICFYAHNDRNTCDRNDKSDGMVYAEHRSFECIDALNYLGVSVDKIYNLGYTVAWKERHIYHNNTEVLVSHLGSKQTVGTKYMKDYHTIKYGKSAPYTRESVISDIVDLINDIIPDEIYAIDLDFHPDHKACSLFFDEAIGKVISGTYSPEIYKGFAYNTSGYGVKDFSRYSHIKPVKKPPFFVLKNIGETDNPMFRWNERIRIATPDELKIRDYEKNHGIQALLRYGRLYPSLESFINLDSVFWKRRTDSVTYDAKIEVSSGEKSYLKDFKIIDIKDVKAIKPDFNCGIWHPIDKNQTLKIVFKNKINIKQIKLYQNPSKKERFPYVDKTLSEGYKERIYLKNCNRFLIKISTNSARQR